LKRDKETGELELKNVLQEKGLAQQEKERERLEKELARQEKSSVMPNKAFPQFHECQ
jgi:hypothetical protein